MGGRAYLSCSLITQYEENMKVNTDIKFSTSRKSAMKGSKGGKAPGKTDMGIPAFSQKVKNLEMLSNVAKTCKGKMRGTDKYS